MPDYRESSVAGTSWRRARMVILNNPLGDSAKTVNFSEEDIIEIPDMAPISREAGSLSVAFDPAQSYPLINPQTGEELGATMSHMELYVALHSLYIHLAKERDEKAAAATEPVQSVAPDAAMPEEAKVTDPTLIPPPPAA